MTAPTIIFTPRKKGIIVDNPFFSYHHTAVNVDNLTCYKIRIFACKKSYRLCNLLRFTESFKRCLFTKAIKIFFCQMDVHFSFNNSGCNTIYAYTRRSQFLCKCFCKAYNRRLCGTVMNLTAASGNTPH